MSGHWLLRTSPRKSGANRDAAKYGNVSLIEETVPGLEYHASMKFVSASDTQSSFQPSDGRASAESPPRKVSESLLAL